MRIGIVLASPPGYSETFFRSKIKGLQAQGHEVLLLAGQVSADFKDCPVVFAPNVYAFRPLQMIAMVWQLFVLIIQSPRVVSRFYVLERKSGRSNRQILENLYLNAHILPQQLDWLHFGFATIALRRENVAEALGAKLAVSIRGYDISLYPLKFPGCYQLLWQKIDKLHTISDDLLAVARKEGLLPSTPVQKITPAIDVTKFQSGSLISEFDTPVRLLTVARLHWKKGLEYTLEALALLKERGIAFRYTIVGEGKEYERLVFAAHQLGILDWVSFCGKVSHDQIKDYYEQADIYLQYSIQEGFCNAVLEAQAMGLLCVVSDAEGLPENVLHEQTGWVVPRWSPKLLANQIADLCKMGIEMRHAISQRALIRVKTEFNIEKQTKEFAVFYNSPASFSL